MSQTEQNHVLIMILTIVSKVVDVVLKFLVAKEVNV